MPEHKPTQSFAPGELERAIERFDWLIEQVRDQVHRRDIFEIQEVLRDPNARTSAVERALVVLGLLGTAEAGAALGWFDPTDHHRRVRLLHRLARRECARRLGKSAGYETVARARRAA